MPCLAGLPPALKSSRGHITLTDHFALKVQGYLPFLWFQRAEWEAEPSAISLPFCGTSAQLGFKGPTPSLFSRLTLLLDRQEQKKKTLHSPVSTLRGRIRDLVSMWADGQAATCLV